MGLPDAKVKIKDGGLGLVAAANSGLHAKVGVCSAGVANQIVSISDESQISSLGTGPLVDALYDSFAAGARIVYVVPVAGDTTGVVGSVTADKTGTGNMTVTGTPLDAFDLVVVIVDPGAKNVATFQYSLDGGDTFSSKITVPTALTYVISNTGLTLNFTEAAETPANSFKTDDTYRCHVSAPTPSVESVNTAIDVLLNSKYLYEFIHLVGPSDNSMWAALDVKAAAAESKYRYIHFLAEARGLNAEETVDQWVTALLTMIGSFASTRVSVCAGRFELVDMGNGRIVDRNGAGIYAGRVSKIAIQKSPGEVMEGSLPGIKELRPAGINDGHILALDEARYITFRQYIGLAGFYITNGRMAAESVSDYRYVELRRPMDKACAQVRAAALKLEHAEIDPNNMEKSLTAMEAQLTDPLDIMAGSGEISAGRVVIPRDQDVLATSLINIKVRIVPKGIMRWLDIDIGYENPFQSV